MSDFEKFTWFNLLPYQKQFLQLMTETEKLDSQKNKDFGVKVKFGQLTFLADVMILGRDEGITFYFKMSGARYALRLDKGVVFEAQIIKGHATLLEHEPEI